MRLSKISGGVVVAVILVFVFVANFSVVESRFQCSDTFQEGTTQPSTAFIKVERYRWWVGLWNDSDASVTVEIPSSSRYEYFSHASEVGDALLMFDSEKRVKGRFSTLSNAFYVEGVAGFFEGNCVERK